MQRHWDWYKCHSTTVVTCQRNVRQSHCLLSKTSATGHLTQALVTMSYHQHHAKQKGVNPICKLSSSPKPFKHSITLMIASGLQLWKEVNTQQSRNKPFQPFLWYGYYQRSMTRVLSNEVWRGRGWGVFIFHLIFWDTAGCNQLMS